MQNCNWVNGGVKQLVQVYGNAIGEMKRKCNWGNGGVRHLDQLF